MSLALALQHPEGMLVKAIALPLYKHNTEQGGEERPFRPNGSACDLTRFCVADQERLYSLDCLLLYHQEKLRSNLEGKK